MRQASNKNPAIPRDTGQATTPAHREQSKRWFREHPEYRRAYRAARREDINRYSRNWMRRKHAELKRSDPAAYQELLRKGKERKAREKAADRAGFLARNAAANRRYRARQQAERLDRIAELLQEKTRNRKPGTVNRTCLKCDREFLSEGKFNRVCGPCRTANRLVVTINANAGIDVPDVPAIRGW